MRGCPEFFPLWSVSSLVGRGLMGVERERGGKAESLVHGPGVVSV